MPVHSLPLPDLRARLKAQVDFLNWHSSLMSVLTASGATRPGFEHMGAAHNPT